MNPPGQQTGTVGRADWTAIGQRLATNEHARDAAGASLGREISRAQLIRWRNRTTRPFPQPVLLVPARGGAVELWDREDIALWLERELADHAPAPNA